MKNCARVSCNTANKWEQYPNDITQYSSSVDYTTYNESSATHYRYDAQKQTVRNDTGDYTLVCRQPNGCLNSSGWYNFACAKSTGSDVSFPNGETNELCWEGYLSYWLPRTSTSTPVPCTVANCATCDSSGTCIECNDEYFLSNGTCEGRVACPIVNCETCDDTGTNCTKCFIGYELSDIGGGVNRCIELLTKPTDCRIVNCVICNDTGTKCTKCEDGYSLKPDGLCVKRSEVSM